MKKNKKPSSATKRLEKTIKRQIEARRQTDSQNSAHRLMQRDIHKAAKMATVGAAPRTAKQKPRIPKQVHDDSEIMRYFRVLARPFDAPAGVRSPVSYNPAPSYIQTTLRSTYTNQNLGISSGYTAQLTLAPGHGQTYPSTGLANLGIGGLDAVSNHAMLQQIAVPGAPGFDEVSFGPLEYGDAGIPRFAALGWLDYTNVLNGVIPLSSGTTATALYWDNAAPYVALSTGGHSRWQLVAMGIRIVNITPEASRGGTVVTVQPNTSSMPLNVTGQAQLESFPTFFDHGVGDRGIEVSWIPRPQDMSFWHTGNSSGGPASSTWDNSGITVFLNAAGAVQTYAVSVVCHWQIAGTLVNTIGSNSPHQPALKNVVEPTVAHALNSSASAAVLPKVGKVVASHDPLQAGPSLSEKLEGLTSFAEKATGFAVKAGRTVGRLL
jgi:hypothetical protein